MVLKSLACENFAVFADRVEFTTAIDPSKKEYLDNTFETGNTKFNKVSFIYGANGSGKTFFCKMLREIQRILNMSLIIAASGNLKYIADTQLKRLDTNVKTFSFDTAYLNKPTTFEIDTVSDGVTYHYQFSVKGKTIVSELLTKKNRRTEKLIERTSPSFNDITLRSELKSFEATKNTVKPEALCLPIAAMLNNELAGKVMDAIFDIRVISMAAGYLNPPDPNIVFTERRIKKYISVMQKADPTIRDIKVSSSEEESSRQKIESDDFENREIITKKISIDVNTEHAVYSNGKEQVEKAPISFFEDESFGTIKLFTALPYLYDVLESGGVLLVDEIENGLHLSLTKEIIDLFSSEETNPNHAQLICTSHQPLLLDRNYRRDQVWVTVKDSFGKSNLKRMSELPTSKSKVNLTTQILKGALDCNPELFFK